MLGTGVGLLVFAILLVALIAECIAAKGGFSGVMHGCHKRVDTGIS